MDPVYRWNARAGRYVAEDGTFVSEAELRDVFDSIVSRHSLEARALLLQLRNREISVSEFSVGMRQFIRDSQLYAAMLAVGGRDQMTQQRLGLVGQRIGIQYRFLSNFINQIRSGLPLDGRALVRAELYVHSAWGTWTVFQQQLHVELDHTEMRNRLRPADHCTECVALTGTDLGGSGTSLPLVARKTGWTVLGSLKPIGQRLCLTRCRCYFEYR